MFDIEALDKCTLRQACEWIAFQRPPLTTTQEEAMGFIRPKPDVINDTIWSQHLPKPTYTWEEYLQNMTIASAKLKLALSSGSLVATGTERHTLQEQEIDISDSYTIDWHKNILSSFFFTYMDVSIDFENLRKIFPGPNTWKKPMTLSLKYEDDNCVYLYTGDIQKTLVKKFARNDNKSRQVIKHIMQHPNKLINRDDLIKANIKGFDKLDRIDTIIKNAFSNLNIYKYFFKDPKTASIEFVPQITNLDIDSEQFDKIIVK